MIKPQVPPIVTRIAKWSAALAPATAPRSSRDSIHRHLLAGGLIVILLAGGVGGWAATTQLSGALIAQGSIVVDSNVKKVQHPTGGIVGKLFVRDGDHVKAGDILVQLDETVMRANLAIVTKGLDELTARKARLEAERDGAATITLPARIGRAYRQSRRHDGSRKRAQAFRVAPHGKARPKSAAAADGLSNWSRRSAASRRSKPQRRMRSN